VPDDPEEETHVADGSVNLPADEDMVEDPDDRGFDPMVSAEIILPHKEGGMLAAVKCRKRDGNGNFVGRKHKNPVLNSTVYEIEFLDGERQEIAYNILAEHLLSQVDKEGKQYH
jgi:hypothetical protein